MPPELSVLNDPPNLLEGPQLLHHLIEWGKHSHACAIDFTGSERSRKYSYREIKSCVTSLVSQIQETLTNSGAQIGEPPSQNIIPVLLPQSPGLYISQLAILHSGGAFCPVNLDAPKERIKFVVGDVAASVIITTSEFEEVVSWENGPAVIILDEFPSPPSELLPEPTASNVQSEDLAYVMYTSGSSGTPKGVAVSHLAVTQSLLAHERHIPPFKRFLQFAAPSFDVSVFEIFFPLVRGCTLVGCNRGQLLNDLTGMINKLEIDAVELTPTVAGSLLQKRSNSPGLKILLTIGEMLTRPIVEEFGGSETKESILYGMYGPTEAAIHCTIYPKMEVDTKPGNIGIPLDTVSTFIASAATDPHNAQNLVILPRGELGELVLGGLQLALGYLNRDDQNKAAFVKYEGSFYYRTGDKARILSDGTIEIHGRMSAGQVKLRGQRVELGEIEDVIYKQPGVKTVVAAVLGSVLVVFALTADDSIKPGNILDTCSKWLPKFMLPSEVVLLQSFPYLPSGKVDKRKLESDYKKQRENDQVEVLISMTDTERAVKRTLEEILGPFSSTQRLATVGLDSLTAIRTSSKLRHLGFDISTASVLKSDTVGTLARFCDEAKAIRSSSEIAVHSEHNTIIVTEGLPEDIEFTMPCTPLQSAMLAETSLDERAYQNWVELDLPGIDDIDEVISSFQLLAKKNSILRTGFLESDGADGFMQAIWKTFPPSQFSQVQEFDYDSDRIDRSLRLPVHVQILPCKGTMKVLIHIHHSLYDAWSLELLLDDLNSILASIQVAERPPFSRVVESYLNGELSANEWSSEDYWSDHLVHLDIRHMPCFHTGKKPGNGLSVLRRQTSIATAAVESTARLLSSSSQALFQAAYSILLSSYLGSADVCFGTIFSGRTLPIVGIEDIAGPCLATLPLRMDVSTFSSFQGLVQALNSTNRKHLEHSTLPLRDILSAAGIHPRQQLFDTLLIWQQTLHSYDHKREHITLIDTADVLEFNLILDVIPGTGNVELKANYQRFVFPESQINNLLAQLEQLVSAAINHKDVSIDNAFEFLENDLLSMENETPETSLRPNTLSSPVEKLALEDPNRPAIEFAKSIEADEITVDRASYSELNSRANQIGSHLISQNVLPDELVCICMEKSIDLYASVLATAKIGAGYLPVTPDIPIDRLQHILREAKVKFVLTNSTSKSLFGSASAVEIVHVDEVDLEMYSPENIPPRSAPDNISYCVFTSGSTGTPKGVLVTQGNLLSNLDVLEDIYPTSKSSRLLQSCSQAFDVSVFEIFYTWRIGGCLCSAVKDVLFRDIERAIRLMRVTHLSLTPTVAALIDPKNVPSVEFLITAGEAVTEKVFNAWADNGLYQGYGPSETTNICTANPKVTGSDSINNIGLPFKNTSVFVLAPGPEFALVPRGGEGEFCFGGSQVFRGYMDKSQEAGRIINHPTFGRLFRSGDFGRLMPDGSLAFTGRKDDQVKIRGQRVELGEINNVMLKSNTVRDCTTMIIGDSETSQQLICFWTSAETPTSELQILNPNKTFIVTLFKTLEDALPAYMIPTTLVPISHLPITPQGKIDRRLLQKQYRGLDVNYLNSASQEKQSSSSHKWTDLQINIATGVAQVAQLPLGEVGPNTSFFSLGIDSISAIYLSRTLQELTNYRVDISEILKSPSVVRLAEKLSAKEKTTQDSNAPSGGDTDFGFEKTFVDETVQRFISVQKHVENILPCTPLQEAMLSAAESSSESLYSNQVIFNFAGDVEKMKSCWHSLVKRHQILRTCFVSTEMPRFPYVQVVLEDHDLKFEVAKKFEKSAEQKPVEPPYSIIFVQTQSSTKMLLSMPHALYDGVALSILYEEAEKLYLDQSLAKAVSFTPFLYHMVSTDMKDSDKFWEASLKGLTPTIYATKKLPHSTGEPYARVQRTRIKFPLKWVESKIQKHSTSLLAACHSVWASLLSSTLQESNICFGNVVSGRTVPVPGIERLVAPCFNTIPSHLSNIHNLNYLEAFRTLQTLNADSLPFQLTPLRRIQSQFSQDRSRLFDTLFILQQSDRELDSKIWTMEEDEGAMDFPLVCEVVPKQSVDALEIILHSHTTAISAEEAQGSLKYFEETLQAALENPRRQILSPEIREKIAQKLENRMMTKSTIAETSTISKEMSPKEQELRDVIADFTDVPFEKIGRNVSIFRLGLDSISTVQVASRLRRQGHTILASDILEHPTIAQINEFLAKDTAKSEPHVKYDLISFDQQHRQKVSTACKIPLEHIEVVRPCTAVQKGMIAQSLHSEGQQYVNSMCLDLYPDASVPKFKAAWKMVCANHEMLRTQFAQSEDVAHPFLMVTYSNEHFTMPWFEDTDQSVNELGSPKELLQQPWSLNLIEKDGKRLVKLTTHHALYDAISIQMILSDLLTTYTSGVVRSNPSINSLLGAILQDTEADLEEKQSFWQRGENKIIVNRFPDLTPLRVSDTATEVREVVSRASIAELEEICRQNCVTIQAAAQATWARLLAAYIGETSTTFGMTLSGRSIHEEADNVSFPTIVTLPVRCDVTGTNAELLSRTMDSNALLHKYQFTPLTSIQKWAGYPEGKIFDTLFAYQKFPYQQDEVDEPWKIVQEEASVDYVVSIEVQPTNSGRLILRLTFRVDLIPPKHADLLIKQYDALLLDTLHNPDRSCELAPQIEDKLLSITPAKENTLPDSITLLHEYVERGAERWPHKIAFEFATCLEPKKFKSITWTYNQLDKESNKIANFIVLKGIEPGKILAICFDKCAEASFAIIGIMKAGCAYVALDPNAPADRSNFIIQDSRAELVFTSGKPGENMKGTINKPIINLDCPEAIESCSTVKPKLSRAITPQDVSYCLYTSGTTGTPKGCLLTHENAVQAMLSFQRLFANHWTPDSKWLQFASFHFDVSVLEQFWSWSVGIRVASAPRDLIFEDIPGAIQQLGITHIDLTPSLARLVHPDDVPSLCKGVFITGGEQLKQEILNVWGEYACIYNGYGPTEATIGVTMYPRVPQNGKPSNIGPQFDNVGSFVLRPGTNLPTLRGGIGELCVSGKLIGKGYLNRPDLTAERFPNLGAFHERVYRTGDLVRILHNGDFMFLGRADDQVKLRGQRLEPSEINEVVKKSIIELQEVVTLVLKHSTQQKEQLVTFFVTSAIEVSENGSWISTMRDACNSRLPGYMVPTHFIPIKSMPLNANNKADSKQLATLYNNLTVDDLQKLSQSSQQNKEWSTKEKHVVSIISTILQVDESAVTHGSNIFELGLDSISIIGFSRALQKAGLESARLSIVKSNTSIESLVKALLEDSSDSQKQNAYVVASQNIAAFSQRHMVTICKDLGIQSGDVETISPCIPVQEGMIFRFLESDSALYFNKFDFVLDQDVNTEKLILAWKQVISNLQILRTKFVETDDGYAQVVSKAGQILWEEPMINYDTVQKSLALRFPFSIGFKLAPAGMILSLQIFHGLYDGNSLTILLRCVLDEYKGLGATEYGPPFQTSLSYGPLVQTPGEREFWTQHLKNWFPQRMPIVSGSTKDIVITSEIAHLNEFEAVRKQLGVTHQAIIQAVWLSALQGISSSNPTIGIVTSGRAIDFEGAEKVIGPLFNTIPFRVEIAPGTTLKNLVLECHDFNMKMQEFQHTPLKDIQKWSPAKPGQALFDTLFVFQRPEGDEDFAEGVWTVKDVEQVADYPLAFEATLDSDSRLRLVIVAQGTVLTRPQAEDLLVEFQRLLTDVLSSGGNTIIVEGSQEGQISDTNTNPEPQAISQNTPSVPFEWTREAMQIRQELSLLADVSEDGVYESSSIFELGLDSIDVIKLSSRLRKKDIEIPVSVIIKSQTISKMVANISAHRKEDPKIAVGKSLTQMSDELRAYLENSGKFPSDTELVLPATPLQQSMVNEMIRSEYKRYFNVEVFRLRDDVEISALREAVQRVIDNSPILRTKFVEIEDPKSSVSYAQIVHSYDSSRELSSISAQNLASDESLENFMDSFTTEAISLALEKQSLFQVRFVSATKERNMVMAISHALYDGTSLRTLHEDISRSYHNRFTERPDSAPFLEQVFQSTTEDAKSFWKTTLSNLPRTVFPKKEASQVSNPNAVYRLEQRSDTKLEEIDAFCKSSRITLQTLGQTSWALVLSHLVGQLDVVFSSVLSCRDSEEASEVMFPLMNTVAVRSVLHGTLSDMLKYMQEMSDTTRQYQHFPLGMAQAYALASKQDQSSTKDTTLFDTLFIYQGRRPTSESNPIYESVYGASEVEFPICVEMEILDDNHLSWTVASKSTARSEEENSQIIKALEAVLKRLISTPQSQVFESDTEGISVCGLPKFHKSEILPTQKTTRQEVDEDDTEWSQTELHIQKALHEVSDVPEEMIHKNSTIFHLGLDSILVLKLPALLRNYGINLKVSDILKEQTITGMATAVLRSNSQAPDSFDEDGILQQRTSSIDISPYRYGLEQKAGYIQEVLPATAGQIYMIRQWQASQGVLFYPTFTFKIPGRINKAKLDLAWTELLQRHDILRTGFIEVGAELVQIVFEAPHNNMICRFQGSPPLRRHGLAFPPINLLLEDAEGEETLLKLEIHHALYDGISLPMITNELRSLYLGDRLEGPTSSFRKFVAHSVSSNTKYSEIEKKWKSYLGDHTAWLLTSGKNDFERTKVFSPNLKISNIKEQAQGLGVSVNALLLAAVSKLHSTNFHQDVPKVIFGIYLANRAPFGEDLSQLLAPTLNILPLCIQNPTERSITDVARDIQRDLQQIGSAEMCSASLKEIYEWTGVRVNFFVNILKDTSPLSTSENKVFQSIDAFEECADMVTECVNERIIPHRDGRCDAFLPSIDLEIRYHGDKIDLGIFAPANMISVLEAKRMIDEFRII